MQNNPIDERLKQVLCNLLETLRGAAIPFDEELDLDLMDVERVFAEWCDWRTRHGQT